MKAGLIRATAAGVKRGLQPAGRLLPFPCMIARRSIILAAAVSLTGCAAVVEPPAPRDGSARTLPSGADAEVNFYDYTRPAAPGQSLTISFDDGSGPRTVGPDLRPREFEFPSTPRYPTRSSGVLKVSVTLNRAGRVAAATSFDLPLRSDWIWGVAIHTEAENPIGSCIGCMGAAHQPIAPELARVPGESLWINWSGNSIRNPAVY